MFSRKNKK